MDRLSARPENPISAVPRSPTFPRVMTTFLPKKNRFLSVVMLAGLEIRERCHEDMHLHAVEAHPCQSELKREQPSGVVIHETRAVPPFRALLMAEELIIHASMRNPQRLGIFDIFHVVPPEHTMIFPRIS
jgi:hypothetical protein